MDRINSYSEKSKATFLVLLLIILAIFQSLSTELWNDEAYYWVFSQNLDWGYLDHPPMVAVLVKLGTSIWGKNEFGVRFFFIFCLLGSIFIINRLNNSKNIFYLLLIVFSLFALQIGGILAVPDNPLLLFCTLFLLIFKNYLQNDSIKNSLLLSLCIAGLLYSKYHGILLIITAIFSYPNLFKKKSFYLVTILSVFLMLPHIFWQIKNDYPSVQYHLFDRSQEEYTINFTLNYILAQILVLGPFIFWIFFYVFINENKNLNEWEKFLRNFFYFVLAFFLLMSLKGKTEANWTAPGIVVGVILLISKIDLYPKIKKYIAISSIASIILLVLIKLQMSGEIFPVFDKIRSEWKGNKLWVTKLHQKTKNTAVVFLNSYQKPSQYMFYCTGKATSYNNVEGRRNQYEYWPYEEEFRGKKIWFVPGWENSSWESVTIDSSNKIFLKLIPNYQTFLKFHFIPTIKEINCKPKETIQIELNYENKNSILPWELTDSICKYKLCYEIFKGKKIIQNYEENQPIKAAESFKLKIIAPNKKGKYLIKYSLNNSQFFPSINSKSYPLNVE